MAEMSANLEVRRKVFLVLVSLVKLVLGKDDDLAVWSRLRGRTHTSNYHNLTTYLGTSHHTTSQTAIYACRYKLEWFTIFKVTSRYYDEY